MYSYVIHIINTLDNKRIGTQYSPTFTNMQDVIEDIGAYINGGYNGHIFGTHIKIRYEFYIENVTQKTVLKITAE